MNLDYVVVGCDTNPMYLDFWPIISKVWKTKFNITPVLGLICDEDSDLYEDDYGLVKKFKRINGITDSLQSQIIRIFLPTLLDGYCLISDIDMIPLSVEYFSVNSENGNKDNIIIYSSDNPECLENNMYPMCYISSHSDLFKTIFTKGESWDTFCNRINGGGGNWYTDQKYIFNIINDYHKEHNNCIFLNRGWSGYANRRIDRGSWSYDPNKVSEGYYIDSHSLRPYNQYKNEIDNLVNLIL
jgi:hypothetical protein